jgi:hypothetical protein
MRECMLQLTESGIKCKGFFLKLYQLLHGPFLASNNISCTSENNYTEGAYKRANSQLETIGKISTCRTYKYWRFFS